MSVPSTPQPVSLSLDGDRASTLVHHFSPDLLRAVADLVLSTTYEGVWLIDANATTSFVNQRMAQMLGYGVQEMLGVPLFAFMDAEGAAITRANLERRRRGVEEQHEFECIRKDGTRIWLLVTANPVYDRAGGYAGSLALIADLSTQKEREQALAAEKTQLERRILDLDAFGSPLGALTYRDPLTRVYNIAYLGECLAREIARASRLAGQASILLVNVDGFGKLLARDGRASAADTLRRLALLLTGDMDGSGSGLLRPWDVVARCGADEFGILAPDTGIDAACGIADGILARLRDALGRGGSHGGQSLSVSIGIAAFPTHAASSAELILAADRAVHRAQVAGGDQLCVAEQ